MKNQHTSGKWEVEDSDAGLWVTGPDRSASVICDLHPRETLYTSEDLANAYLIAAAPDLLAACKELLEDIEFLAGARAETADGVFAAREAIAKATASTCSAKLVNSG